MRLTAERARSALRGLDMVALEGSLTKVSGMTVEARGVQAPVGSLCEIESEDGILLAEVVGFANGGTTLMPLRESRSLAPGDRVWRSKQRLTAPVGDAVLGRVLDGLGNPLDGGPALPADIERGPLHRGSPSACGRRRISEPLETGVRAIDGFLTVGRGQRVGIFAGSGVGKSTLLGDIVASSNADVAVVALIGERGREVGEFVDEILGDSLAHSVVIAATSDSLPIQRLRAAHLATAIAEAYRDKGQDVLLVMDSLTRFAYAVREIGLAAGEPPTVQGYPPSLYTELPRLVERMGMGERGSITSLLTVLVEGDDMNDPVADIVRGLLDGHVVLTRKLAERAHFPAIDVLGSVSRTFQRVVGEGHREAAAKLRRLLAIYEEGRDLVELGAYQPGSNPALDRALRLIEPLNEFLRQSVHAPTTLAETTARLEALGALS